MQCEVCARNEAKYACPKCALKTCCLRCVNIHKKELECDGKRDRTKFVYLKSFTEIDFLDDYRMLENVSRFVYDTRSKKKLDKHSTGVNRELPVHLYKLKCAARRRGTVLLYLLDHFTRRKVNTTRLNYKLGKIFWRIEWIFLNSHPTPLKLYDAKCDESLRLGFILNKHFDSDDSTESTKKECLAYYRSSTLVGCRILLRAEKVKCSGKKYYELDPKLSLKDNLAGKCIVEFPTIYVVLKDHTYNFDIVDSDDELNDSEPNIHDENTNKSNKWDENDKSTNDDAQNSKKETFTIAFARQKKKQIEDEIAKHRKSEPKNFLFPSECASSDEEI